MIDCKISCPYIMDLCKAAERVGKEYYLYEHNGREFYMERVFAYELYHQLRLIMEDESAKERYEGLYLCGEQTKSGKIGKLEDKKCPDLVLHESISEIKERQVWVCEIKHEDSREPEKDIMKLAHDLSPLGFRHCIFLCFNAYLKKLPDEVLKYKHKGKEYEKIICIICNSSEDGVEVTCKYLKDFS